MQTENPEYKKILAENEKMFSRFEGDGINLSKRRAFYFTVSLPNQEACKIVRKEYWEKFTMPEGGVFVVVNDPSDFRLILSLEEIPSVEVVSKIEHQLLCVSRDIEETEVTWEFKE